MATPRQEAPTLGCKKNADHTKRPGTVAPGR